jgi:hypothetical protein
VVLLLNGTDQIDVFFSLSFGTYIRTKSQW